MSARPPAVAQQRFQLYRDQLVGLDLAARFSAIHRLNLWAAETTPSGLGSEPKAVAALAEALPSLCARLGIETIIDAPCGDGAWIAGLDLGQRRYIGLDIVPALIEDLTRRFADDPTRDYRVHDLTRDTMPRGDMIICRDCLVHLSHDHIARVLARFKASGSTWLLTTHFTGIDHNADIADGDWRPLNLCCEPFAWHDPALLIDERCDEMDGAYRDKTMGLWSLADLPIMRLSRY